MMTYEFRLTVLYSNDTQSVEYIRASNSLVALRRLIGRLEKKHPIDGLYPSIVNIGIESKGWPSKEGVT